MIQILVLKTENKVIYNKSNLNCKTFFEEFIWNQHISIGIHLQNQVSSDLRMRRKNTQAKISISALKLLGYNIKTSFLEERKKMCQKGGKICANLFSYSCWPNDKPC